MGAGLRFFVTGAAMPAAVAWWNLLQDQFRHAVASAMPAEAPEGAGAPSAAPDAPAAEPATRARRNGRSKADKT